ncbi:MAG: DUF1318 domain-containing protein [Desulfovibrio sp.]|nr:MAG: DUF1318 domain-containing protein [Desulfovibrio sp.]
MLEVAESQARFMPRKEDATMPFRKSLLTTLPVAMATIMALSVIACVTVNIYFPAAEVQRVADDYTDDVYGSLNTAPPAETPDPSDDSSCLEIFLARVGSWIGPAQAHAQDATTVTNSAIRGLKDQNIANLQQLTPYLDGGYVGINNSGLLEERTTDGLDMQQVSAVRQLIAADNQVRQQLFVEVAGAMGIDPSQVSQVQDIFSQTWRQKAPSTWPVQDDGGSWNR